MCYEEHKFWTRKKGRGIAEKAVEDAEWTICGFLKQGGHVQYVRGEENVIDVPTRIWLIPVPFLQKKKWKSWWEVVRLLHLRFEVILQWTAVSVLVRQGDIKKHLHAAFYHAKLKKLLIWKLKYAWKQSRF